MDAAELKAEGFENRGDDEHPFGYVYFSDGARLPFALGSIWEPTPPEPYWPEADGYHLRLAIKHLAGHGIIVTSIR